MGNLLLFDAQHSSIENICPTKINRHEESFILYIVRHIACLHLYLIVNIKIYINISSTKAKTLRFRKFSKTRSWWFIITMTKLKHPIPLNNIFLLNYKTIADH